MRRNPFVVLALVAAWAVSALVPASTCASDATPRAVSRKTTYDFGTVKQGATVVHSFVLGNPGSTPLKISRIDLSAPGMTARAVVPMIRPGGAEKVAVEWNTEGVYRKVSGTATIHFDDPNQPDLPLVLAGMVTPPIDASPIAGFFISVFQDQGAERAITIVNNQDHPLKILKLESSSQLFAVSLKTRTVGKVYALDVKVPAGFPLGHHLETISLVTDDPKFPRLQIPVNLFIKADLFANPDIVDFGELSIEQLTANPELLSALSRTIMVQKRKGQFEIQAIQSDLPALQIRSTPAGPSERFQIDIEVTADRLEPGQLAGTIRVLTTDDQFPELTIPVRAEVN